MKARLLTAVVGIAAVIALVTAGGILFTAAIVIVAALSWYEYARMLKPQMPVYTGPALTALAVILAAAVSSSVELFAAALLTSFVLLLFLILVIPQKRIHSLFYTVLGVMYFGIGYGSFVFLRGGDSLLAPGAADIPSGLFLIWFALIGTWSSDTFAYAAGKNFGRRKMAPHISPNKTVEGLIGGVIGCIVMCMAYAGYFSFSLLYAFFLSLMIAVAAPMGDLFESYIKRVCDIKDSGNILPGHGGMMDRFDSLLFVAPLMTAFLLFIRSF